MSSKSSQIHLQSRKQKPARVPNKWRNLPAYGHGITPTMKARPVIDSMPYEEAEGFIEDFKFLMPVSLEAFMAEHAAMLLIGYHALGNGDAQRPCQNCSSETVAMFQYAKRHRNGKPNYDWAREFFLCPHCLHVGETILVQRAIENVTSTSLIHGVLIRS